MIERFTNLAPVPQVRRGEEAQGPSCDVHAIVELVRDGVGGPGTWEVEGASISAQGESSIVVGHTVEVQRAVARFLDDLRAFAASAGGTADGG